MILTELYTLNAIQQRKDGAMPSMYGKIKIRWLIPINADGSLRGNFLDQRGATKGEQRGKEWIVPDLIRSSGIKAKLLADNGEYVLGLHKEGADAKKVAERYRQFKELILNCAEATQEPSVQAIARFYEQWNPEGFQQEGVDPADNFTFEVHGVIDRLIYPARAAENLTAIQDFWASYTAGEDSPKMMCLVTGKKNVPVEVRLPGKIKGIPNGQTAGTSLVSANAAPFSSYGLENSLTSPISRDAAEGFNNALNRLITGQSTRVYLGPVVYTFWTREESRVDTLCDCMDEDQPEEVRDLFRGAKTGQRRFGIEGDRFYALGLSASGGRAVVRSWIDVPIEEVRRNLNSWFEAQKIVDKYGQIPDRPYFSVKSLARAMYRKGEDFEMQCSSLINVALRGGKLPGEMLARAVRRTAIEHDLPHHRAALIKLILTKNDVILPQTPMNELNLDPQFEHETDKMAYHCGRLLAHLESVQRAALGDINTTLIDRYYGAASHTPGKVFGELVKDAQAHLRKLRVTKPGVHEALQQRMEGIMVMFSPATEFPNTLTMQQQSIFSLGYYHQRASSRKEAMARKAENAAKKAEQAPENATV
jgi:CRISPR-associated protein Csd1